MGLKEKQKENNPILGFLGNKFYFYTISLLLWDQPPEGKRDERKAGGEGPLEEDDSDGKEDVGTDG